MCFLDPEKNKLSSEGNEILLTQPVGRTLRRLSRLQCEEGVSVQEESVDQVLKCWSGCAAAALQGGGAAGSALHPTGLYFSSSAPDVNVTSTRLPH